MNSDRLQKENFINSTDFRQTRRLGELSFLVFFLTSMVYLVDAGLEERAFFGDGLHYFLGMVEKGDFGWSEPSRRLAHNIMKLPVIIAMRFGSLDLHFLAKLYALSLLCFPLIFTCLACLSLPKERKHLFVYPVMVYLAGIAASSFQPIGSAQFGASYFWLLAFLLMFSPMKTAPSKVFISILCIPTLLFHEAYAFLGILLFSICAFRAYSADEPSKRLFFITLCIWFTGVILLNIHHVVHPRSLNNREGFIHGILNMNFMCQFPSPLKPGTWRINGPAFLGALGFIAIFLMVPFHNNLRIKRLLKMAVFACSLFICLDMFISYRTFWPSMQTAARAHGAILSFGAFIVMVWIEKYAQRRLHLIMKDICLIILVMSIAQMTWHMGATRHWHNYLQKIDEELNRSSGLIRFEESLISKPLIDGLPIRRMVRGHNIPCLSITRGKNGSVKSIIGFPSYVGWRPCDPCKPERLPRLPEYDYILYVKAFEEEQCD